MERQVANMCETAYYKLFTIGKIRKFLTKDQTKTFIHAYVTSELDSNNSLLLGSPKFLLTKLKRVQNAAQRLIAQVKKQDHMTPILHELHWLTHYKAN